MVVEAVSLYDSKSPNVRYVRSQIYDQAKTDLKHVSHTVERASRSSFCPVPISDLDVTAG